MSFDEGYKLRLDRTVDYKLSVWMLRGELFIPFHCGSDGIILLGFGRSDKRYGHAVSVRLAFRHTLCAYEIDTACACGHV